MPYITEHATEPTTPYFRALVTKGLGSAAKIETEIIGDDIGSSGWEWAPPVEQEAAESVDVAMQVCEERLATAMSVDDVSLVWAPCRTGDDGAPEAFEAVMLLAGRPTDGTASAALGLEMWIQQGVGAWKVRLHEVTDAGALGSTWEAAESVEQAQDWCAARVREYLGLHAIALNWSPFPSVPVGEPDYIRSSVMLRRRVSKKSRP